jgi:dolichol kinase
VTPWSPELLPPPGTLAGEAVRGAVVGLAFLALFAAAEAWRAVRRPPGEWTRKLVHVGGGAVSLALPWLIASPWTVLVLASGLALLLWGTSRLGLLRSVHGVQRRSQGGVYFPIAVFLLFLVGRDQPVFYVVAILTLLLADALAALLGSAYGRYTYAVEGDRRSIEGSTVFFLTTFLGVHLPILLLTDVDRAVSVLVALQVALLVTFLEAVSLRGNDNLLVPLATFYFLVKMTPRDADFLLAQFLGQLVIVAAVGWIAWRSHLLSVSGALAATLFFYGAFALGGPEWTVAPAMSLAIFLHFYSRSRRAPGSTTPSYQVLAVFYVSAVPLAAYFLNNTLETLVSAPAPLAAGDLFYPLYVGALAAQVAALVLVFREGKGGDRRVKPVPAMIALSAGAPVVVAGMLVAADGPGSWLAATVAGAVGYGCYLIARSYVPEAGLADLRVVAASAAAGAVLAAPLVPAAWPG